jgi:oligoendopeptidase F
VRVEETWDLTTIYQDDLAWDADATRIGKLLAAATAFRGRLGESAAILAAALDAVMEARRIAERLHVYASLRRDEDIADDVAGARYERAFANSLKMAEALAFVRPEVLAIPAERLDQFMAEPALATYRHLLDDLARQRAHVRSVEVEEVLAQSGEIARGPRDAFMALDNADLVYGRVRDETGAEIELTKARYRGALPSPP